MEYKDYQRPVDVKSLGIKLMYDDEFFIILQEYKEGKYIENHIISNYGRIFIHVGVRWKPVELVNNITSSTYKVYINAGRNRDTLSITKLMIYNFDRENYLPRTYYYLKDPSKPIVVDNICNYSPKKTYLTPDQDETIIEAINRTQDNNYIYEHYDLPRNAARRFIETNFKSEDRRKKQIYKSYGYEVDNELSKQMADAVDSITNKDLEDKSFRSWLHLECNKLNIICSNALYSRAYNYFAGISSTVKVYRRDIREYQRLTDIDHDTTEKLSKMIDDLTNGELNTKPFRSWLRDICPELNLKYSMALYTRAYKYLCGNASEARVYVIDKLND